MKSVVIVIDNIYDDPDQVREIALAGGFDVTGNFPGARSEYPYRTDEIKNKIELLTRSPITNWNGHHYNGAFQLATLHDKTWIHSDSYNNWAGVLYLTPNPPINSGTVFFRHRASGADRENEIANGVPWDGRDYQQFDVTDKVINKYNRLVLYDATLLHASESYFGNNKFDGRLFQTFFFSV